MKRILSSQIYQLTRDKTEYRLVIIFTVLLAVFGILVGLTGEDEPGACQLMIHNDGLLWMFQLIMIGIMVGKICAGDFKEKDINYELMGGHLRSELFLARVILGTLVPAVLATVLAFVPVIANALCFGFGDGVELVPALLRVMLFFFPFLRFASFFVLVAFITRNQITCTVLSFFGMFLGSMIADLAGKGRAFLASVLNLIKLMDYETWSIYNIDQQKGIVEYFAYDSSLDGTLVMGTIVISLVMSAVYLLAAYGFFRRDDLD